MNGEEVLGVGARYWYWCNGARKKMNKGCDCERVIGVQMRDMMRG